VSSMVASAGDDGACMIWDRFTGAPSAYLHHFRTLSGFIFHVWSCLSLILWRNAVASGGCIASVRVCPPMSTAVSALALSSCGKWLATADEGGWLQLWVLEDLVMRGASGAVHPQARRRPSPAAGAINSLSFRQAAGTGSAQQLVCDTGYGCSVFDVAPRTSLAPGVRLSEASESPASHTDQAFCVGWAGDYVCSGDMSGGMRMWRPSR
jgi:WD40 repeat protein